MSNIRFLYYPIYGTAASDREYGSAFHHNGVPIGIPSANAIVRAPMQQSPLTAAQTTEGGWFQRSLRASPSRDLSAYDVLWSGDRWRARVFVFVVVILVVLVHVFSFSKWEDDNYEDMCKIL